MLYNKQINLFIEMVLCVAVDCKSDNRYDNGKISAGKRCDFSWP